LQVLWAMLAQLRVPTSRVQAGFGLLEQAGSHWPARAELEQLRVRLQAAQA